MSFTLFVILPSGDVCSLRRLPSGSSVRAVRKALELTAGLPAHTYDLACLKNDGGGGRGGSGGPLADDVSLELGRNVWDGFVLRACLRERFLDLYRAVLANDLRRVLEETGGCVVNGEGVPGTREDAVGNGEGAPGSREDVSIVNGEGAPGTREDANIVNGEGVPGTREDAVGNGEGVLGIREDAVGNGEGVLGIREDVVGNGEGVPSTREALNIVNGEAVPGTREGMGEGGAVALFVASFLGMADMCTALLSAGIGVDPDSTTPFGRTALFAAMHGDHARVMEVLLRHSASLEARDADGASAVDVAHARQAKDSLRKMRQLRLWSRANSASSSSSSSSSSLLLSRTPPRRWDHHPRRGSGKKTPQHVIRIPTTTDACAAEELLEEEEEEEAASSSSFFPQRRAGDRASSGSGRILRGGGGRSASPPARTDPPPSNGQEEARAGNAQEGARATTNGQEGARAAINGQEEARAAGNGQEEARAGNAQEGARATTNGQEGARAAINGQEEARAAGNAQEGARATTNGEEEARATSNGPPPPATAKTAPTRQSGRPSPSALFPRGEVRYTWDGNLRPLSRTSSTAGTPVRIPVPTGGGGRDRVPSGRSGVGAGGHRSDAVSEAGSRSGSRGRQRSVRVSVQEFSLPGPYALLKLSVSPPRSNHPPDRKMSAADEQGVWNHGQDYEEPDLGSTQADEMGQDPPERPPTPADGVPGTSRREGRDTRALPAGSLHTAVPEPGKGAKGDRDTSTDTLEPAGPSPRAAAAARAARDKGGSPRAGPSVGKSRRKKQQQQASWRTMKRRLKLAEEHKRHTAPTTTKARHRQGDDKTGPQRASFEQWLERKNKERRRHEPDGNSSGPGSSSDGGCSEGDGEDRAADNEKAFSDWLRDLRERPLRAPHPFTPASLHRRKSRPLKNLIQVGVDGVEAVPPPDPDGYMRAYKDWRRTKGSTDSPDQPLSPRDLKEAWHRMEEKRKSLLSAALTYEDWLEHSEQRQKLMQAILRSRSSRSSDTEQDSLRRAPRQISFLEWRERVGKREAETRHDTHHRKQTEPHYDQNGVLVNDVTRSSAAIPHEEWLKRKRRERQKSAGDRKVATGDDGSRTTGRDVGRRGAGAGENNRSTATVEEEGKEESAWELWLQRKHQNEMERLSKGVY